MRTILGSWWCRAGVLTLLARPQVYCCLISVLVHPEISSAELPISDISKQVTECANDEFPGGVFDFYEHALDKLSNGPSSSDLYVEGPCPGWIDKPLDPLVKPKIHTLVFGIDDGSNLRLAYRFRPVCNFAASRGETANVHRCQVAEVKAYLSKGAERITISHLRVEKSDLGYTGRGPTAEEECRNYVPKALFNTTIDNQIGFAVVRCGQADGSCNLRLMLRDYRSDAEWEAFSDCRSPDSTYQNTPFRYGRWVFAGRTSIDDQQQLLATFCERDSLVVPGVYVDRFLKESEDEVCPTGWIRDRVAGVTNYRDAFFTLDEPFP